MHQAQPKEGHKIWLTQEADAKSWSSLKQSVADGGTKSVIIIIGSERRKAYFCDCELLHAARSSIFILRFA
jgi:hypothetical protein